MSCRLRRSRNTNMLLKVIGLYLITVIPVCIWNIVVPEEKWSKQNYRIWGILIYCLYWLQYGVNHLIYFYACPKYGKAFHQLWRRLTCRSVEPQLRRKLRSVHVPRTIYVISNEVPMENIDSPACISCIEYRLVSGRDLSGNESMVTFRHLFDQEREISLITLSEASCSIIYSSIVCNLSEETLRNRTVSQSSDWSFSDEPNETVTSLDSNLQSTID